jgi:hypothetical protein
MTRFRLHRLSNQLSLLAIFALLWSQLALANHPACTLSSMLLEQVHAAAEAPCHDSGSTAATELADEPACASHCSRSDLSSDTARILAVPTLGLSPAVPVVTVQRLVATGNATPSPAPLGAWHRPTLHPASLLLI